LYLLENGQKTVLYGKPLDQRVIGEIVPLNGLGSAEFTASGNGVLVTSAVFDDKFSFGYIDLARPGEMQPVKLEGVAHTGVGELVGFRLLKNTHYGILFNIDGCSWLYEGIFNEEKRLMSLRSVICGEGDLSDGTLEHWHYDKSADRFALSFSTATSPTQI
jgi:hypothetical protein